MNKYFILENEEIKNIFNYKENKNYNKNLDITYELEVKRNELGKEKKIKVKEKEEVLVCRKGCKECRKTTDKAFNLLQNNCGKIEKKDKIIKIHVPKDIKDNQSILIVGEGKKENKKYGNLLVNIKLI